MADVTLNRGIFNLYFVAKIYHDIQDILVSASEWPRFIRKLFWMRPIQYFDRILLCSFCFMNGLYPHQLNLYLTITEKNLMSDYI